MSAEATISANGSGEESASSSERCRVPNCWRNASAVRIAGETAEPTVLCDEHARIFFGVSS